MRTCSLEDCDAPYSAKGLCAKHYKRDWARKSRGYPKPRRQRPTCSVTSCDALHEAKGFCNKHYGQTPEQKARRKARRDIYRRTEEFKKKDREYKRLPHVVAKRRNNDKLREYQRIYQRARRRRTGGIGYQRFRIELHAAQDGKCAICDTILLATGQDSHVDHIIPVSKGGSSERDNLQLLCPTCNIVKGNKIDSTVT